MDLPRAERGRIGTASRRAGRRWSPPFLLATLAACAAPSRPPPSETVPAARTVPVDIEVVGVRVGRGPVRCAVYRDRSSFMTREGIAFGTGIPADDERVRCSFALVPGETVAISVFQDLDDDESLGRGAFGIPSEPWGTSGRSSPFVPPRWDACAVTVGPEGLRLEIVLIGGTTGGKRREEP